MVQQDPLQRVLLDLSKMRGKAYNDMLRLPAPDPFKEILTEVDRILSQTEDMIRGATVKAITGPEKWARNLREIGPPDLPLWPPWLWKD